MARQLRKRSAFKSSIIEISSDDSDDDEIHKKRPRYEKEKIRSVTKKKPSQERNAKTNKAKNLKIEKRPTKNNQTDVNVKTHKNDDTSINVSKSLVSTKMANENEIFNSYQIHELLANNESIDEKAAENIVKLFEEENTIPFICRYRRDIIKDITPEKLRDIKCSYEEILNLNKRANTIIKHLKKENVLTNEIHHEILSAKNFEELEYLYAPYKSAKKSSLAERAKTLGLDKPAEHILYGKDPPTLIENLIQKSNSELDTNEKIINHLCNVISHVFSKTTEVLEELKRLQKINYIILKSTKLKSTTNNKENKQQKMNEYKYEIYFNFEIPVKYIKPHQILAINRGEKSKYLSVKIIIPDKLKYDLKTFTKNLFLSQGIQYQLRQEIFEKSFDECYVKKLYPLLSRQIRSELNKIASKASIDVFTNNLKQLLLTSPLKGEKILGIDPGFSNGCKLALISETANVLETDIIYPHSKFGDSGASAKKLIEMLTKHDCNIIALGNGTACRETEFWLSKLFENGYLDPNKIRYSIISEQGASIYSCSDIAKKEFPDMDVNLIGAVSIARRLNDPLSEYVKVEPRHIGVGMYQHDINQNELNEALNEVVTECVSFVGVDINTASLNVLKYIAGLTTTRAKNIIEYRTKNGAFKTRRDLLNVKGIGPKTFTQCAGFIRIEPLSIEGGTVTELLDCTWVHPESYDVAEKIIKKCGLSKQKIGQKIFIKTIQEFSSSIPLENLEKEFKIPKERIAVVLEALQRELFQDYRTDINKKPLFKQGITKMSELKYGSIVTGAVTNITHFGAFVNIGVEHDGLIHTSNMNGTILNIGDRITSSVLRIDLEKHKIQLKFENFSV